MDDLDADPARMAAPPPPDEQQRLTELHALGLLAGDGDPVLDAVTRLVAALFDVPTALVTLVAEERQHFVARVGMEVASTPRQVSFCAHALLGPEALVVEDARVDPRFAQNPLVTGAPGIAFYAGAPVRAPSGARLGTVCAIDRRPRSFGPEQRAQLQDFATIVEQAIARRAASVTDPMTGLYDRRGFEGVLEHAVALSDRGKVRVTVAYADVDDLKGINDRGGHAAGDAAIQQVADTLRRELRASDVVGRLGGDEFGMIMFDSGDLDVVLRRIEASLPDIGVSVGAVDHQPGEDVHALIDRADRAMYEVKRRRPHRRRPSG